MKLILILTALVFSMGLYASTPAQIIQSIENGYNTSCIHKKDTTAFCFGSMDQTYTGVCYFSKKYTCDSGIKVKIKMRKTYTYDDQGQRIAPQKVIKTIIK